MHANLIECKNSFYLYAIILNSEIKNHTFKSLIHLSVSQCQTAWKIWKENIWDQWLYGNAGGNKTAGYICHSYSELYIPLFVVDYSIYFIFIILLLVGVFKRDKLYVLFEALNHYQQWFIVICWIIWSGNSLNILKTLFLTLTPYLTPFASLRIFYMNYINGIFDLRVWLP